MSVFLLPKNYEKVNRPGWRQAAQNVYMCTVLFRLAQRENEKKAQALLKLSLFHMHSRHMHNNRQEYIFFKS